MSTEKMPKNATGLFLREGSNVWQWGIVVPADLKPAYDGRKWAFRGSLNTTDRREATLLAAQLRVKWLATFEQQRHASAPAQSTEVVTTGMARQFAQQMLHDTLNADWVRMKPAERKFAMNFHRVLGAVGMLEAAGQMGVTFALDAPEIPEATHVYLEALSDTLLNPKHVERPPAPALTKPVKPRSLRDVFNQWNKSVGVTRQDGTVRAKELALEDFEKFAPGIAIADITRLQGQQFKALLLAREDLESKTQHQRLVEVKTLLKYAAQELEWIPKHPWAAIDIEYSTANPRAPWTPEQVAALFGQPLFTEYALPTLAKGGADAGYWIPLLGAFTGARVGELVQLRVADINQQDDRWGIAINEDGGKQVKTAASVRWVPLHSELVRLGLLDYADAMRKAGYASLWPKLKLMEGKPSHGFSAWFNSKPRKAVEGVALPDFHSFRHTVRTKMNKERIAEKVQDAITGHEDGGSTGRKVYTHLDTEQLVQAIESVTYPGLSLPKVYKAP